MHTIQNTKRLKVRPFLVTITRNGDSLIGCLTQNSQDLHFELPLCGHDSKYYIMGCLVHIPVVSVQSRSSYTGNTKACYVNLSIIILFVLRRNNIWSQALMYLSGTRPLLLYQNCQSEIKYCCTHLEVGLSGAHSPSLPGSHS